MKNRDINILVVDDSHIVLKIMESIISTLELNVITVDSGKKALSLAKNDHFALILLDVIMPEMDGYETAHRLRLNRNTISTPIIFISSKIEKKKDITSCYETGAVDFFKKCIKCRF